MCESNFLHDENIKNWLVEIDKISFCFQSTRPFCVSDRAQVEKSWEEFVERCKYVTNILLPIISSINGTPRTLGSARGINAFIRWSCRRTWIYSRAFSLRPGIAKSRREAHIVRKYNKLYNACVRYCDAITSEWAQSRTSLRALRKSSQCRPNIASLSFRAGAGPTYNV